MTMRLLPTDNSQPVTVNGRLYTPVNGTMQTVPTQDAEQLLRNGWVNPAGAGDRPAQYCQGDVTANRPSNPNVDDRYYDTTLSKSIVWTGAAWRDVHSGASV